MNKDFIEGFALETGLTTEQAIEQWSAHSRQMDTQEREEIEGGGFELGRAEGVIFKSLYPEAVESE